MVTYGDMMSLLLTFFIMLVSMAEQKQDGKMRAALDSLEQRFGPDEGHYGTPGNGYPESGSNDFAASSGNRSEGGTKPNGQDSAGLAGPSKTVKRIGHGTLITLGGACVFEPMDDQLSTAMIQDLNIIAGVLATRPNRIVIRGHACPPELLKGSKFNNAWDLSYARANAVAQYLMEHGIAEPRIELSMSGVWEPLHRSKIRSLHQENARVDVFVIDAYTTPVSEGSGGSM